MGITFDVDYACEKLSTIQEEALPLLTKHYHEISYHPDLPLDIDWERYESLETSGNFMVFTARTQGKLIGYNAFYILNHGHHKTVKHAIQDAIFIEKDCRGFGKHFIQWCDETLKALGTRIVYQHLSAAHNYGAMLEDQGYTLIDQVYGKRFKQEEKTH